MSRPASAARRSVRWLGHELIAGVTAEPFERARGVYDHAAHAAAAARMAYAGASGVSRGGRFGAERQRVATSIGGEVFHGVSDKRDALELLRAGYGDLRHDLVSAAPTGQIAPSVAASLDAFDLFYDRETDSMLIRWATEWTAYQAWWLRLRSLREACRAAGIPLASADPAPLPRTVWQRGSEGVGTRVDAALSLGRTAALATMGVMGAWGLFSALRSLREVHTVERVLGVG